MQVELGDIDTARLAHGGVFGGDTAEGAIPPGQAACSDLLDECYGARTTCRPLCAGLPYGKSRTRLGA